MCKEVMVVRTDGSYGRASTKIELERLLGGAVPGLEGSPNHTCLCPMDDEATATRFNCDVQECLDPYGSDLVFVVRKDPLSRLNLGFCHRP